jgi:hypothetical protein
MVWPDDRVFTAGQCYPRLCQAVIGGAGGKLSKPLLSLPSGRREAAIWAFLELPDHVELLSWREDALGQWPASSRAPEAD